MKCVKIKRIPFLKNTVYVNKIWKWISLALIVSHRYIQSYNRVGKCYNSFSYLKNYIKNFTRGCLSLVAYNCRAKMFHRPFHLPFSRVLSIGFVSQDIPN